MFAVSFFGTGLLWACHSDTGGLWGSEPGLSISGEGGVVVVPGDGGGLVSGDGGAGSKFALTCTTYPESFAPVTATPLANGAEYVEIGNPKYEVLSSLWAQDSTMWATSQGTLVHYDGSAYSILGVDAQNPSSFGSLWGSGLTDVWAVGTTYVETDTATENVSTLINTVSHWDGNRLCYANTAPLATDPSGFAPRVVTGRSAQDIWLFADDFLTPDYRVSWDSNALLATEVTSSTTHCTGAARGAAALGESLFVDDSDDEYCVWNGTVWSRVTRPPNLPGATVTQLYASRANDLWLLRAKSADKSPDLERWDGVTWTASILPADVSQLSGIAGTGPSDVWVAGQRGGADAGATTPAILHFDGTTWSSFDASVVTASVGTAFKSVAVGPHDVWAVTDLANLVHLKR